MKLSVFRGDVKIGLLDLDVNEPFFGFTYDNEYLASSLAMPLSVSLPLTDIRYPAYKAQPYFEGLLPEGDARNIIARRLGISRKSSVKLLRALGRDCAGDISIIDESESPQPLSEPLYMLDAHVYSHLDGGLSGIAKSPREEIPRLQEESRLSLAGGQEKIALYHSESESIHEDWYIPLSGSPSTHIIKPGILENHYPHITLNEFLCLHAAKACGICSVDADILFPETPIIVIRRYDRLLGDADVDGLVSVSRVHQEDCCQACGVISDLKYEHDGGPGFGKIRDLLVKRARRPIEDITMFVRWGIFNYLIGNCDAHAKNLSVLHNSDGTISLAPIYDLISTAVYDGRYGSKLSRSMGMRIGLHENIDRINTEDFSVFARDVHMRLRQVMSIGVDVISKLPSAFNEAGLLAESKGFSAADEMVSRILTGCERRAKVLG